MAAGKLIGALAALLFYPSVAFADIEIVPAPSLKPVTAMQIWELGAKSAEARQKLATLKGWRDYRPSPNATNPCFDHSMVQWGAFQSNTPVGGLKKPLENWLAQVLVFCEEGAGPEEIAGLLNEEIDDAQREAALFDQARREIIERRAQALRPKD